METAVIQVLAALRQTTAVCAAAKAASTSAGKRKTCGTNTIQERIPRTEDLTFASSVSLPFCSSRSNASGSAGMITALPGLVQSAYMEIAVSNAKTIPLTYGLRCAESTEAQCPLSARMCPAASFGVPRERQICASLLPSAAAPANNSSMSETMSESSACGRRSAR